MPSAKLIGKLGNELNICVQFMAHFCVGRNLRSVRLVENFMMTYSSIMLLMKLVDNSTEVDFKGPEKCLYCGNESYKALSDAINFFIKLQLHFLTL